MSKSTSINDLPKNQSGKDDDLQESMMVNSILKEIENEEEVINDENEDSLKYIMDTSQIPPKIQNEIPTTEMIQSATNEYFNQDNLPPMETPNSIREEKKEISNLLNDTPTPSATIKKSGFMPDVDGLMNNIKNRILGPFIILCLFMLLTFRKVNDAIFRLLPKLRTVSGDISSLGNLLKGLVLAVSYFIMSFFI